MTISDWSDDVARAAICIETDIDRLELAIRDRIGRACVQNEIGGLILAHHKLGQLIEKMTKREAA